MGYASHVRCSYGEKAHLQLLLERGVDPWVPCFEREITACECAVEMEQLDLLEMMLKEADLTLRSGCVR
jgi:hypothetical protein